MMESTKRRGDETPLVSNRTDQGGTPMGIKITLQVLGWWGVYRRAEHMQVRITS